MAIDDPQGIRWDCCPLLAPDPHPRPQAPWGYPRGRGSLLAFVGLFQGAANRILKMTPDSKGGSDGQTQEVLQKVALDELCNFLDEVDTGVGRGASPPH
jgi:hypothetical protein